MNDEVVLTWDVEGCIHMLLTLSKAWLRLSAQCYQSMQT